MIVFLVVFYGSFIEPQLITVTRETVHLDIDHPISIAVISDLHVGPYKGEKYIARVVKKINSLMPDIVLIVGDLVLTENVTPEAIQALAPLKDLKPGIGTFSATGNHDHGVYRMFAEGQTRPEDHSDLLIEKLRSFGITVLENDATTVNLGTEKIAIAGIDDLFSKKTDFAQTLTRIPANMPVILLAHNPDVILYKISLVADLIVSGHTHGGQIRLPGYGPISALPTRLGRKFDQGLFALEGGGTLAITRGVGESGPRARLFAPPEILLLTAQQKN
jgi:predicted MPP superfamily phosphohydrolase